MFSEIAMIAAIHSMHRGGLFVGTDEVGDSLDPPHPLDHSRLDPTLLCDRRGLYRKAVYAKWMDRTEQCRKATCPSSSSFLF